MKEHTTYKIGGPAKYFFVAKTENDLMSAIKASKNLRLPTFIFGGGSNLLVSDKGFKGLVVKIKADNLELKGEKIYAPAGVMLGSLARFAAQNGFSGFEWAGGIPGTVGGAVFGHAQAFGEKISDWVESVETLDLKTLKIEKLTKSQCKFSLKNSIFKENKNLVIVSVLFSPQRGNKEKLEQKLLELVNYRNSRHPMSFPSAGSVFINPEKQIKNKKLLEKFPELVEFNKKGAIHAGYLIEKAGLKGKKIGSAQISEQHANFIINLGNAKAKDVAGLVKLAQKKVKKLFGISLKTEIRFIGF